MKKYIQPTVTVYNIEINDTIMTISNGQVDTLSSYSTEEVEGDAPTYRNNLWD